MESKLTGIEFISGRPSVTFLDAIDLEDNVIIISSLHRLSS
jgi:hypothetical protein